MSVAQDAFFELVSDGNLSLMRAVEKFDFARGYAFATYAAWAIVNGFARATLTEYRRRERFRTNHGETVLQAADGRHAPEVEEPRRPALVASIIDGLDPREREIIVRRFGLRHGSNPLTLAEISSEIGVTKERVRQTQVAGVGEASAAGGGRADGVPGVKVSPLPPGEGAGGEGAGWP